MSAWITDRLPTREDADRMKMVWVCTPREVYRGDYRVVSLGEPWQPITYPEPYVKPKVWTWEENEEGTFFVVSERGVTAFVIDRYFITISQIQAMTDALNRLEEGV